MFTAQLIFVLVEFAPSAIDPVLDLYVVQATKTQRPSQIHGRLVEWNDFHHVALYLDFFASAVCIGDII